MSKIALITGATSGIGAACAHLFAAQGYHLILLARREERLTEIAKHLEDKYAIEVKKIIADVRDHEDLSYRLDTLPASWKKVNVLINNAGLSQGLDPIDKGNFADWDTMIDTNVKGLLYTTKIVSNWMVAQKSGHIINIGSIAGQEVYPNGNVYCATKHAVDALNKSMRIDLLPHGIRVTAINPGMVETEFSKVRFKGDESRAKKVYDGLEPLVANDIAEAIWFAVSRPAHVNINDMLIMPTAQATATIIDRN
ncbi:SDR family NAD(P)-dependent oxidoreductase [Pedobacter metabolipauper]|uniref:NADP-dependent 3-hydroxy acid dehydrogenase YdfG n=1 Tax=Pedobacter metabolipauper TaxID=425513 RepID=A0A4R6STM7_9SPHI|nr:SDR family NAD(P)-dependent oxidoreductase [Pedobacter metabolipauper]TDQ07386.1 NADP-dependent 3-hydroxy acid dehydrogenase YdfG [Pedobacter metabolipauper]